MKRILAILLIVALLMTSFVGCQATAKHFGGTYEHTLEPNQKLLNVTWKDDTLWYHVREMKDDEEAETYIFQADSEFGVFEGKVIINEVKE